MPKKGKRAEKRGEPGRTRIREPFVFLGVTFKDVGKRTVKRHLAFLVIVSLVTKLVVLLSTTAVFSSFIDLFDFNYHLQNALLLSQGKIPYVTFSFDYPVLILVPVVIALAAALVTQDGMAFVYTSQLLMVLCNIGILLCVYFIGLRVRNERAAWFAGLIYATAFSAAYFVLTRYDALPTFLFMGGILFAVYAKSLRGYLSATLGFFTKVFPAIAVPFMILYHAKGTSLRQEILSVLKIALLLFALLLLPFLVLNPASVRPYLFATGTGVGVYANSAAFTLYAYLRALLGPGITPDAVGVLMTILMIIVLLLLLFVQYREREQRPEPFLKILLCAVFSLVFFTKFHSPQYGFWFTPLLCLLVADSPRKILLFYVTQAFGYAEFPLLFGSLYVNLEYVSPPGSAGWYLALAFFTLEYLALLALIFLIVRPREGVRKKMRELLSRA
jgi:hypothetical protein